MVSKKLFNLAGKEKNKIYLITVLNLFILLSNVGITAMICTSLAKISTNNYELQNYTLYISIILVCLIVKTACTVQIGKIKNNLGNTIKKTFRTKTMNKIFEMGQSGGKTTVSTMTQLTIEGLEQLSFYFTGFLPSLFYALLAPIVLFIICVFLRWQTAVVLIACLPLIPISIVIVSKYAQRIFTKYWNKYISMGDGFLDSINGMKELKIFDADKRQQVEIAKKSEEFRVITMKVLVMQLCSLTIIDLVAFGGAALAIVLSLINPENVQTAPFVALFLVLISAEFFLPMRDLGSAFHVAMNGSTAGNKIMAFLDTKSPNWGEKNLEKIKDIRLKNVHFNYVEKKQVLKGVSISFEKGLHALVGESGCGKSTVAALLTGSIYPSSGAVTIDSIALQDFNKGAFFQITATVSVNTHIFNMSIRDNFLLANKNATNEEIMEALKQVRLYDFVQEVGGLDYLLLEDAQNISGGQKQRLAFAINTLTKRQLYIFDEPTSNIDIESEEILMQNIYELSQNAIVVLISHRLQNVVKANTISILKDGQIAQSGTHSELMASKGEYYELYTTQYNLENAYKNKEMQNA